MIFRSETRYLQRSDIFLQCCILQLSDCPAFRTDQMRMCLRQHPQLILHSLGCQLMTHNQATVYQNVDCVINSSPTDMKIHFLQFLMKQTHIEMTGETAYNSNMAYRSSVFRSFFSARYLVNKSCISVYFFASIFKLRLHATDKVSAFILNAKP